MIDLTSVYRVSKRRLSAPTDFKVFRRKGDHGIDSLQWFYMSIGVHVRAPGLCGIWRCRWYRTLRYVGHGGGVICLRTSTYGSHFLEPASVGFCASFIGLYWAMQLLAR
jgi:hypothetical protein